MPESITRPSECSFLHDKYAMMHPETCGIYYVCSIYNKVGDEEKTPTT
jgi:hypothetical protein